MCSDITNLETFFFIISIFTSLGLQVKHKFRLKVSRKKIFENNEFLINKKKTSKNDP